MLKNKIKDIVEDKLCDRLPTTSRITIQLVADEIASYIVDNIGIDEFGLISASAIGFYNRGNTNEKIDQLLLKSIAHEITKILNKIIIIK